MINIRHFHTTKTGRDKPENLEDAITSYIISRHRFFKDSRTVAEETWLEAWSMYVGTPDAVDHQREQTIKTVGLVNNDWRHRINTGKAYECVETIHGYLMGALFPNREWFNLVPKNAGYANEARVLRKYLLNKFTEGNFRPVFEKYLRQLLVCGVSVLALPWRYETHPYKVNVTTTYPSDYETSNNTKTTVVEERRVRNHPEFDVIDVFDMWLDPTSNNPNTSDFIRRIKKTRADIIHHINNGEYQNLDPFDVVELPAFEESDRSEQLSQFQGIQTGQSYCMDDIIEVLEFWGDVHIDGITFHDVKATVVGEALVCFEPNQFWAGKPFVVGSITELPLTPYSIGVLQPNLGLLHQLNLITNQRLDNLELAVDEMWTLRQNSTLTPEEVYTAPGKVFLVEEHDDLRPVQRGGRDFTISYQEAGLLEQVIDKNSGTGNLISANAARSGERVTAAEIQAVRDAGGNRLSNIHRHIEETSLLEILRRVYRSAQQFVREEEVVRVAGTKPGEWQYVAVDPESLNREYNLIPIGADYVTDETKYVRSRMELIGFVSQIPQMSQRLNYEQILYDVIQHMGFEDPESYIAPQQQAPQQPAMGQPDPMAQQMPPQPQQPTDPIYDMGGVALQQALQANLNADGGASLAEYTTGVNLNAGQ